MSSVGAHANDRLKAASDELEARAKDALAAVRQFPAVMEADDWTALDRRLSDEAGRIRGQHPGIEAGYYVPSRPEQPYLPALPNEPRQNEPREVSRLPSSPPSPPRRNLYDYVDTQVDAAFRKGNELSVVEDIPPYTIAIRTAPVRVNGRVVAATWTMTRLVDPIYIDQSARGYRMVRGPGARRDRPLARPDCPPGADGPTTGGRSASGSGPSCGGASARRRWGSSGGSRPRGPQPFGRHPGASPSSGDVDSVWADEGFDHLIDEVDRLEEIVSRLLQFSRADAQDLTPGDLNIVWPRPPGWPTDRARGQGNQRRARLEPDLPPVQMAPPALVQVLRNLTTNALQVMPRGGVLRLATRFDAARGTVVASVADDGPGLRTRCSSHLFEPFFTTKAEGTGLGLAIAREIALAHRGDLHAPNRPGGGAVFTLTLPVAEAAPRGRTTMSEHDSRARSWSLRTTERFGAASPVLQGRRLSRDSRPAMATRPWPGSNRISPTPFSWT